MIGSDPEHGTSSSTKHSPSGKPTSPPDSTPSWSPPGPPTSSPPTKARAARVRAGTVEDLGIELADGTYAGVGDTVVTRRNDRRLTTPYARHLVKNGDTWTVYRRHRDGDLPLVRDDQFEIRVPHAYVIQHVELVYATTAARAQGRTVDTAHALIDHGYTRETLYVALTRARFC